jgi:hypothetical protein
MVLLSSNLCWQGRIEAKDMLRGVPPAEHTVEHTVEPKETASVELRGDQTS